MKKYTFLICCFALYACDNTNQQINGHCIRNERTVTTTEQDGQIIKTINTETFLCKCIQDTTSFIVPQKDFSYEHSQTNTFDKLKENVAYTKNTETIYDDTEQSETQTSRQDCDKQCTTICKKLKK